MTRLDQLSYAFQALGPALIWGFLDPILLEGALFLWIGGYAPWITLILVSYFQWIIPVFIFFSFYRNLSKEKLTWSWPRNTEACIHILAHTLQLILSVLRSGWLLSIQVLLAETTHPLWYVILAFMLLQYAIFHIKILLSKHRDPIFCFNQKPYHIIYSLAKIGVSWMNASMFLISQLGPLGFVQEMILLGGLLLLTCITQPVKTYKSIPAFPNILSLEDAVLFGLLVLAHSSTLLFGISLGYALLAGCMRSSLFSMLAIYCGQSIYAILIRGLHAFFSFSFYEVNVGYNCSGAEEMLSWLRPAEPLNISSNNLPAEPPVPSQI